VRTCNVGSTREPCNIDSTCKHANASLSSSVYINSHSEGHFVLTIKIWNGACELTNTARCLQLFCHVTLIYLSRSGCVLREALSGAITYWITSFVDDTALLCCPGWYSSTVLSGMIQLYCVVRDDTALLCCPGWYSSTVLSGMIQLYCVVRDDIALLCCPGWYSFTVLSGMIQLYCVVRDDTALLCCPGWYSLTVLSGMIQLYCVVRDDTALLCCAGWYSLTVLSQTAF